MSNSKCVPRRCTWWLNPVWRRIGSIKPTTRRATAATHLGTQWLQSLLDIQNETRDAAEFWDHVKVDLYPDAVYVFTPKSQILALPRGATVVDFAYAIHSSVGDRTTAAKVNGDQVPLRTELKNGDVVEVITAPVSTPNPAWLGFVRTGRARSKIRHYLKTLAQHESQGLGEKMLIQALRAEGIEKLPEENPGKPGPMGQGAAFYRQSHPCGIAHRPRVGQTDRHHGGQAPGGAPRRRGRPAGCPAHDPLNVTPRTNRFPRGRSRLTGARTLRSSTQPAAVPCLATRSSATSAEERVWSCMCATALSPRSCSTRTASGLSPWSGRTSLSARLKPVWWSLSPMGKACSRVWHPH